VESQRSDSKNNVHGTRCRHDRWRGVPKGQRSSGPSSIDQSLMSERVGVGGICEGCMQVSVYSVRAVTKEMKKERK